MDGKVICEHNLSEIKGSFNQLQEHRKEEGGGYYEVMERLRSKWNCYDFQHFINGFKKENGHFVADQLRAVDQYLDEQKPEKSFVAAVMKECCENYRYKFSQFKAVFEFRKLQESATGNENTVPQQRGPDVEYKGLEAYSKAFQDRVVKAEVETA
jgi:hypothetical protein